MPSHGCQHVSSLFLSDFPKLSFKHEPGSTGNIAKGAFVRAGDILNYFRAFFTGRLSPIKCTDNAGDSFHPHSGGKLSQTPRKRALAIIRTGNPCKNPAFYRGAPSERRLAIFALVQPANIILCCRPEAAITPRSAGRRGWHSDHRSRKPC